MVLKIGKELGSVQMLNFSWAQFNLNLEHPKISKVCLSIQMLISICQTEFSFNQSTTKCQWFSGKLVQPAFKICYNDLCSLSSTWKVQRLKAIPIPKFPAELCGKNGWAILNSNSCHLLIQTLNFPCTRTHR